jgi:hypothetical protein
MKTRQSAWLGVLVFAVVACGSHPSAAASHPAASPRVVGALQCRLPVAGFVPPGPKGAPDPSIAPDGQDNQHGTGGFLDLPSGKYTAASNSDRSYLAGAGVWVPAMRQAISPDETFYVVGRQAVSSPMAAPTTTLYVVDVRTKAERKLFAAHDGDMAVVLAITAAGVYVETMFSGGPGSFSLYLIDPASGTSRPVAGSQSPPGPNQIPWMAIAGSAAWGMSVTNGQTTQPTFTLLRLGLDDGKRTSWYESSGPFGVAGFDAEDNPILLPVLQPDQGLSVLTAPGKLVKSLPQGGTFLAGRGTAVTDEHGTWIGSADGGIWLLAKDGSFKKVATVPPQAGATGQQYDPHAWRSVAGPCV